MWGAFQDSTGSSSSECRSFLLSTCNEQQEASGQTPRTGLHAGPVSGVWRLGRLTQATCAAKTCLDATLGCYLCFSSAESFTSVAAATIKAHTHPVLSWSRAASLLRLLTGFTVFGIDVWR